MHDLGTLGEFSSVAQGINNSDEVVGYSIMSETDEEHAFLYSDGVMRDLNSLIPKKSAWVLSRAYAINDNGHIVGVGIKGGHERAFLMVPSQKG
jgi:probable HAF family extracellular repeat protein